jgi:glucokinase
MILAGDIGGTSTRLGIFEPVGADLRLVVEQTSPNRYYSALDDIVLKFAAPHGPKIHHACFGVAGPVLDGVVQTPNLPWLVESRTLADKLALKDVILLNDLEANAYGIAELQPKEFVTLNEGDPNASGNAAIIAAGTGLGEAGLFWNGEEHIPFACEGGHADFAPNNDLELELLKYLHALFGHVSWERVLSGPGLHNIYKFLRDTRHGTENSEVAEEMVRADPAMVISKAAMEGRCARCVAALDMFVALYGAAAGNLALKMMARGGVFLGGGIAPKIINKLCCSNFMRAFVAKGRMQALMESIPVRVLANDKAALLGAARYARQKSAQPALNCSVCC